MTVGLDLAGKRDEFVLDTLGQRTRRTCANFYPVNRANRRDLHGGAAEENLFGDIKHFARNNLLGDGNIQIAANREYRVASDTGQCRIGKRRSDQRAVHYQENVFAGTLANVAMHVERDAFHVAVRARLHADELGVHVIRGGLSHLRQGVGRGTIPGADAHIHSAAVRFFTEIFSPVPASEIDLDRTAFWVHARFAVTAHDNRPQVALADVIDADEIEIRRGDFVEGARNFHAVDVG